MKKTIGILPLWDEEKESLWMLPGYLEAIKEAGGLPLIFPFLEEEEDIRALCGKCDGFLFTGGQDVSPELYGQLPLDNVETCPMRDRMETVVLAYALEHNQAILGICRGIQLINAAMGGSLYQDLPTQYPSDVEHRMFAPYDRSCHKVTLAPKTPLAELLQREEIGVNSCHHQAVKELAPGLQPMAVAEDGLIEAVYMPEKKFLWAMQWHPEFSYRTDENSRKIFEAFIKQC